MITYPMAVITAPGKIEFQDRTLPEPGLNDVLVRVKAAAICGSDLHIYKGKHPAASLPSAVGHEIAGEVIATGKEVTKVKEGDRVTIEPILTCGRCEFCRRGDYHLCIQVSFQYRRGQGGFAPYFIVHEDRAFRLPESISDEEGALVEPLSVALHAVKISGIRLGQSCAIFGAGAIGLLVLQLARRASGGQCFVVDVRDFRLQQATSMGASHTINNRHGDAIQIILEKTGQMGVDRSFEAVGIEATLVQALQALKKGGKAIVMGIFENPEACLPVNLFVQKEISLAGSQGYHWDFQDAISLLKNGYVDLMPFITHRLPLERLQEGFDLLMDPQSQAIKVLMKIE